MSRYRNNNYKSIISIAIVTLLLTPIALNVGKDALVFTNRDGGSEDTTPFEIDGIDQNEKAVPTSSLYRKTRSLEEEYISLVSYDDVLIVRNLNSPISMEIADYFKEKRNIPDINVCNITTSTSEKITRTIFENEIRSPVEDHIINNGLVNDIEFIVTTKGVPLRIDEENTADDDIRYWWTWDRASVDSELAIILGPYNPAIGGGGFISNPYHDPNPYEPFDANNYGFFLVTRLTAFNVTQVKALIDKVPEAVGKKGTFVFDVDPGRDGGGYQVGNDWMRGANAALTAKGFDVILDETDTFLTGNENVSGYTSWGSNDGHYRINDLLNSSFESDGDGDGVPDDWYFVNDTGIGTINMDTTIVRSGSYSINITRTATSNNASYVAQNYTIKPDTRYYITGYVNRSGVSSEQGVHLQIIAYDSSDKIVRYYNGTARTGTANWQSLPQVKFEPIQGVTKISVGTSLSKSSGTVFVDDMRLYEIKPHNSWLNGALVETYVSTSGRTFNYPAFYGQSLAADLILDGVSGTKGYVWEPYLDACAHPDILFDAYTDGFYSAESYYMASQFLSWMDVVVCDPKLAVYKQSMIPDLAITPFNISFSEIKPITGETINIYADVQNLGNYSASDVVVHFYAGDPDSGGTLIGEAILDVSPHGDNQTYIVWNTTGYVGEYDIYVVVDAIDRYYELSENNNRAFAKINILNEYALGLEPGWNLISLPLMQMNTSLSAVLESISGDYDDVRYYNSSNGADLWKHHSESKPVSSNDLTSLNHSMGFWIYITKPGGTTLNLKGFNFSSSQSISLYKGWNLVGYPSLTSYNRTDGLNNTEFGTHINVIYWYDASTRTWHNMGNKDRFERGRGYWVHAREEIVWHVPL